MQIEELDLNTRNQIYNSTKKVIRKYQKGISSGKLTAEKFADNIFTNKILLDILDESIINQADFQNSYINYINSLMQKQNENFKNYMDSKHNKTIIRSTVSLQILLKNILKNSDYSLNIPIQYLNKKDIEAMFAALGQTLFIQESQFDAFTAFSCAGPAYIMHCIEGMIDAGVQSGFSRFDSRNMVLENFIGCGLLLQETDLHPFQQVDRMTSPAGVTIEGVAVLNESGLTGILMKAVKAALDRTKELS